MAIKDWPEAERPRERLLAHGAGVLSDAELLAVFLGTGSAGRSAIDVGRTALAHFGGLNALLRATPDRYAEVPGLGPARYALLQAVVELARRALKEDDATRCSTRRTRCGSTCGCGSATWSTRSSWRCTSMRRTGC